MRVSLFLLMILLLIGFHGLSGQDNSNDLKLPSRYGGSVYFGYNQHLSNFVSLPELPNCCPEYTSGYGVGYHIGLLYEIPFSFLLSTQIGINFSRQSRLFETIEKVNFGIDGQKVPGLINHELDITLNSISFSPSLRISPFADFSFLIGGNIGFNIFSNYSQKESIVDPSEGVVFIENGLKVRNENSGSIENLVVFNTILSGGIRYEIPINRNGTTVLAPEIIYDFGLNPIIQDVDWKVNSIRAGISLIFVPYKVKRYKEESIFPPQKLLISESMIEITDNTNDILFSSFEYKDDQITAIDAGLTSIVKAVGVNDKGFENPEASIDIEEFLSTNMRPILNYIFFDYNSAEIPDRYIRLTKSNTDNFRIEQLTNLSTLSTYYQILNIIGSRMRKNPNSKITFIGCNSDNRKETENLQISKKRAQNVADYLTSTWMIDPERIEVFSQNLPNFPTRYENEMGYEENRRVEIYSDSWEIMKPVVTNDTLNLLSLPKIKFYPKVYAMNGLKSYELKASQFEKELITFSDDTEIIPESFEWNITQQVDRFSELEVPISFILHVEDLQGNRTSSNKGLIPVELITIDKKRESKSSDKRIDRYSLILFPFGSSELTDVNLKIAEIIKTRIKDNSEVLISGHTDKLGDENDNLILSVERAKKLSEILLPEAYIRGLGETKLLYDNDLPEGRFYSRTIEVKVQTPIKW